MPTRIGGSSSVPVSSGTVEHSEPTGETAAPQVDSPQGWAPKLAGKARTAVRDAAVNQASKERSVVSIEESTTLGNGVGLSFSGKVTEKVALKTDDPLVTGDPRRRAAAASGDLVWTKLSVSGSTGAAVGHTLAPGIGASLGFSAGAEVTAVVAADKSLSARNVGGTAKEQGEVLALAFAPDRLLADGHRPGTELMVRGYASSSASLGASSSHAGIVTANIGVGVSASHGEEFTKNVKVLEDGKVYAQVAKVDSNAQGISAGVGVGLDLPNAGGLGGKALNAVATKVEDRVRLGASIGASSGQVDSLRLGGIFDLKTQKGREAFAFLMKADPLELQAHPRQAETTLRNMGMGVAYSEQTRTGGVSANIQIGQTNLLSFSSARRTTEGVLLETKDEAGAVVERTQLDEQEYNRNVTGALPRLMLGEERTVSVRAGSVTKNGVETRAALASLNLQDPKVTQSEQKEWSSFASQMGVALPEATKSGGKGTFAAQLALTEENLQKLNQRSEEDIRTAFTFAKGSIEGGVAPWTNTTLAAANPHYRYAPQKTVKAEFEEGAAGLDRPGPSGDETDQRATLARDYRATTGRDLESDVTSFEAMNRIAEELVKARGKPVTEWGSALSAIGSQRSQDVRTALLALYRLSDASLISLSINANGATTHATPGAAPKSSAEIVGPILTPAGVN